MKYLVYGLAESDCGCVGITELYPTLEAAIFDGVILNGLQPSQFRIYELKELK